MKIGIDIGGTKIRAGLVDESLAVRKKVTVACPSGSGKNEVVDMVIQLISSLSGPETELIGAGVPAVVDKDGIVYDCVNIPSWDRVELKSILEARFKVPVKVNNDCNCFARGVANSNYGRDFNDIVCMTLGTGVGAGLIINRELYTGRNSCAGEIGCIQYKDKDYEAYCSSLFFKSLGTTAKAEAEKAEAGDEKALKLWAEFGSHIGDLINTVTFAYDPQLIFIGGGIAAAYRFFEPTVRKRMAAFPYSNVSANLRVMSDPSGDYMLSGAVI